MINNINIITMDINNTINQFIETKMPQLIQLYIQERQNNKNELGVLFLFFQQDNVDVRYLPLSHSELTDELRNDIISRNNNRNSNMFITIMNHINSDVQLIVHDLE
jgi:hypothetical protein